MDEKDFEIIKVLSETKNITRAQDRLYLTQSALSKRLKAIEDELGVNIVSRSRQGVRLTQKGETVLDYTMKASATLKDLRVFLNSMNNEVSGTLNVGFSVNFARYKLTPILEEYHRLYPKVHLHIVTDYSYNLYKKLLVSDFDLIVLRGDYIWDGYIYLLSCENICLVHKDTIKLNSLDTKNFISHITDIRLQGLTNRWMHENLLDPRKSMIHVDSLDLCVDMVKRGMGWALIPEIALEDFDGYVKPCIFKSGKPFQRCTYIMCPRETLPLEQVTALIAVLKSNYTISHKD